MQKGGKIPVQETVGSRESMCPAVQDELAESVMCEVRRQ